MGEAESTARKSPWICGPVTGLGLSVVASLLATLRDWQLNPSRLFHSSESTHWNVVLETAWSWFWPLSLAAVPVSTAVFLMHGRRSVRRRQGIDP